MVRAALITLVGASSAELVRFSELLSSVEHIEGENELFWILVADNTSLEDLGTLLKKHQIQCHIITNPASGPERYPGKLGVGVLAALGYLATMSRFDLIVKIDTDAIAIAPFVRSLRRIFVSDPQLGLVGSYGETSNRRASYYRVCSSREPRLLVSARATRKALEEGHRALGEVGKHSALNTSLEDFKRFLPLLPLVELAASNGYEIDDYCQGGAYAIAAEMPCLIASVGGFSLAESWSHLPFGEDEMMAMLTYAVGRRMLDFSAEGETFGIQFRGLPYSLATSFRRQHALIHSMKRNTYTLERLAYRCLRRRRSFRDDTSASSKDFFWKCLEKVL